MLPRHLRELFERAVGLLLEQRLDGAEVLGAHAGGHRGLSALGLAHHVQEDVQVVQVAELVLERGERVVE